jgi:hypothetical protein
MRLCVPGVPSPIAISSAPSGVASGTTVRV